MGSDGFGGRGHSEYGRGGESVEGSANQVEVCDGCGSEVRYSAYNLDRDNSVLFSVGFVGLYQHVFIFL